MSYGLVPWGGSVPAVSGTSTGFWGAPAGSPVAYKFTPSCGAENISQTELFSFQIVDLALAGVDPTCVDITADIDGTLEAVMIDGVYQTGWSGTAILFTWNGSDAYAYSFSRSTAFSEGAEVCFDVVACSLSGLTETYTCCYTVRFNLILSDVEVISRTKILVWFSNPLKDPSLDDSALQPANWGIRPIPGGNKYSASNWSEVEHITLEFRNHPRFAILHVRNLVEGEQYEISCTNFVDIFNQTFVNGEIACIYSKTKVDAFFDRIQPFYRGGGDTDIEFLITAIGREDERIGGHKNLATVHEIKGKY